MPVVHNRLCKVPIDRTAGDDAIVLIRECVDRNAKCIESSVGEENFIRCDLPVVMDFKPTTNSLRIFRARNRHGVAEHFLVNRFM